MKIVIKTKNIKLTPAIRNYIEKKIGELERFIQKVESKAHSFKKGKPLLKAWVEIGRTTRHHQKGKIFRAECQIKFPGKSVRSESVKTDLYLAIDEVKDELQREFKKYTEKQISKYKRGARKIKRLTRLAFGARFKRKKGERVREEGI